MKRRFWCALVIAFASLCSLSPPTPAAAQACTNDAELVSRQSDPAVDAIVAEGDFVMSWTLRNSGDCPWTRGYRLRFVDGERMDGPRSKRLAERVESGDVVTLSLDLAAPAEAGDHLGVWRLHDEEGEDFGPDLAAEVVVGEDDGAPGELLASGDVILPEVLVFGGKGGSGDFADLSVCLTRNALPKAPAVVVDEESLAYRQATLYLCSLPEGAKVTVEAVDPEGNRFSRDYVEDGPELYVDEEGVEHTGTVLLVSLSWPPQTPSGDWTIRVYGADLEDQVSLAVPEPAAPEPGAGSYPRLDNRPEGPIDPFAAALGCTYAYSAGEAMVITGAELEGNATYSLGIYQERMGEGYLAGRAQVRTDDEGAFSLPYSAPGSGEYSLWLTRAVDPAGLSEDGVRYDTWATSGEGVWGCFSVITEAAEDEPLRIAYTAGAFGLSDIRVMRAENGAGYYLSYTFGECDASEPAWWPGGEWVAYQSNCLAGEDENGFATQTIGDYDLYARLLDDSFRLSDEETLSRLTATSELDETEPDVNAGGIIVYRQAPAGTPVDESGDLWLLDIFEETATPLGPAGRSPAWSPDGGRIAFMSDQEGRWQVYVFDLASEETWLASEGCATHCRYPAWSPDGQQIVYSMSASLDDLTPTGLWVAPAAGGRARLWLSGGFDRPAWSEEGLVAAVGPGGLYLGTAGRRLGELERYLYQDPAEGMLTAPAWSR